MGGRERERESEREREGERGGEREVEIPSFSRANFIDPHVSDAQLQYVIKIQAIIVNNYLSIKTT